MLSDKVGYDINSEFEDNNYKSCFARSVVNSQHQQEHLTRQLQNRGIDINKGDTSLFVPKGNSLTKTSRTYFYTDRNPSISSCDSRRSSACSSRIAEMPVENLLLKSQIETLQWQLKQTESSKEMYRELMIQVVRFLERAYHSLQLLGSKVSPNRPIVPRSNTSQTLNYNMDVRRVTVPTIDTNCDYTAFRDFTWRRPKKTEITTEEISPEKLSQEAFRLLRTAQSLLNTHAPDLAQLNNDASEDINFLEQLAKEFPRTQENGTHRPDSCCSSTLQIGTPDKDVHISTAFNRKLSLRQNTLSKRNSFDTAMLPSSSYTEDGRSSTNSHKSLTLNNKNNNRKFKLELENSSPTVSSVSSAEDESGFSSMNSFQEIGIPLINSTVTEEETQEEHTSSSTNTSKLLKSKDLELWKTPKHDKLTINHKKWNSTPADTEKPLKVLWV